VRCKVEETRAEYGLDTESMCANGMFWPGGGTHRDKGRRQEYQGHQRDSLHGRAVALYGSTDPNVGVTVSQCDQIESLLAFSE
jgi:hypothetical protein